MKKTKFLYFILTLLLITCAFSACSKFKYDNSTIYAKVSAIDGQKVTLLVGEMNIDIDSLGKNMFNGNFQGR